MHPHPGMSQDTCFKHPAAHPDTPLGSEAMKFGWVCPVGRKLSSISSFLAEVRGVVLEFACSLGIYKCV